MLNKGKNDGVQILRAVLFLGIIAFHCGVPASQFFWGGVESFFVISSFFLTKKLMRTEEIQITSVFVTRLKRLYPQYIIVLFGSLVLYICAKRVFPIKDIIFHVLSLQNFNWMATGYSSELVSFTAHTWTLAIEIWLFVVWLIAFKVIPGQRGRIVFCIVMGALAVVYRVISIVSIGDIYITSLFPIAHADAFAIGSLMAFESKRGERKNRNILYATVLIIGCVFLFGCFAFTATENNVSILDGYKLYKTSSNYLTNSITGNVYLAITLISASLLYFCSKYQESWKWMRPLVVVGNISYTGYLIHWPIRVVVVHFTRNPWLAFIIVLLITIVGSIIIDKLIGLIQEKIRVRR